MTRIRRRPSGEIGVGAMTETEWQTQVYQLLDLYAWDYRYHVMRSKMSPWGWPDIVAVRRRDRRILFAELKSSRGEPTPDQVALLELLLDVARGGYTDHRDGTIGGGNGYARIDVELWRPGDTERVMEVLR